MKLFACIVLLALALGIVVPPSLPFLSHQGAMAAIGTLDVCHTATPALFSNGDMPSENEQSADHPALALLEIAQIVKLSGKPCFIAYQEDRPPKPLI